MDRTRKAVEFCIGFLLIPATSMTLAYLVVWILNKSVVGWAHLWPAIPAGYKLFVSFAFDACGLLLAACLWRKRRVLAIGIVAYAVFDLLFWSSFALVVGKPKPFVRSEQPPSEAAELRTRQQGVLHQRVADFERAVESSRSRGPDALRQRLGGEADVQCALAAHADGHQQPVAGAGHPQVDLQLQLSGGQQRKT